MLPVFAISSDSVTKYNRENLRIPSQILSVIRKDTENKRKYYLQFVENMLNNRIRYYTFKTGEAVQSIGCRC